MSTPEGWKAELHWLPVSVVTQYCTSCLFPSELNLCCLIRVICHDHSPKLSRPVWRTFYSYSTKKWTSFQFNVTVPRLHIKFGERAFLYSGPSTCNPLPDNIRFQKLLKSHDFSLAFNVCQCYFYSCSNVLFLFLCLFLFTFMMHLCSTLL